MLKIVHVFLFTILACGFVSAANLASAPSFPAPSASVFQDDLRSLDQEFEGLNQLEKAVAERNATYAQLSAEQNALLKNTSYGETISSSLLGASAPGDERALGIPGFLWGFCFGLLGVVLVYVAIDDEAAKKREGKSALIGCLVGSLVSGLIYAIAIAASQPQ